jgi:hypothetical protein
MDRGGKGIGMDLERNRVHLHQFNTPMVGHGNENSTLVLVDVEVGKCGAGTLENIDSSIVSILSFVIDALGRWMIVGEMVPAKTHMLNFFQERKGKDPRKTHLILWREYKNYDGPWKIECGHLFLLLSIIDEALEITCPRFTTFPHRTIVGGVAQGN